jgi:hypothetical protein
LREELDYGREAAHMRLYGAILGDEEGVAVPRPIAELSTRRLLTMTWLDGAPIHVLSPILTSFPITTRSSTATSAANCAEGCTIALGWMPGFRSGGRQSNFATRAKARRG